MADGGYRSIDIYQHSFRLAVEIHKMTFSLPKFETYEEGQQIRRAAKSIPANIAEGYGRRYYKNEFIKFLIYALSSCDEVRVHLDLLYKTGSLAKEQYAYFTKEYITLGIDINKFLRSVIKSHNQFSIPK